MISLKSNYSRIISLVVVSDIIHLVLDLHFGMKTFIWLVGFQLIATFINLNYDKGRIYEHIKTYRESVLSKKMIIGKYTNWERTIIKAGKEENDELLISAGKTAFLLEGGSVFVVLNLYLLIKARMMFGV
ncbi:hypothetical protein [Fusibacter sp. JL216-2]|uniref:hypothetical protein n=1 Tax=Fusibacter sp. JL216-2 TaxID=3071453 RepID=UPI003D32EE40